MTATIAYATVGGVVVLAHGESPPLDDEWESYLRYLENAETSASGVLVVTDGTGPDGRQRQGLNELVSRRGGSFRTAVVTQSVLARGLVTALSWFNSAIRAFAPDAMNQALEFLGVSPAQVPSVRQSVVRLRLSLVSAPSGPHPDTAIAGTAAAVDALLAEPLASLRKEVAKHGGRPSVPR